MTPLELHLDELADARYSAWKHRGVPLLCRAALVRCIEHALLAVAEIDREAGKVTTETVEPK